MDEQIEQFLQALRTYLVTNAPLPGQPTGTLNLFVFFVQWSAIILSAVAGLQSARKYGMDIYGGMVIGFVVSLGGGTMRDLLLGRYPIFWIADPIYAVTVLIVVPLGALIGHKVKRDKTIAAKIFYPMEQLADDHSRLFITIDSLALGLWAYLGTDYALQLGTPLIVAPILGVITASFGGVLRDVFFVRVPQSFMPGQLYVVAAIVGTVVYVVLWGLGFSETVSFLACFALTFIVRIASIRFNIQLY